MQENYVDRILKAKVYDVAVETSLESAPRLSRRLDNRILFKREDLQPVFSFKIRGAYNKIAQLSPISAQRGVICASAGNHAQGVALGARTRGIPAVIVMPLTSPDIKVQAVADLGGEIVLHELWHNFFSGNQVDHGKAWDFYPWLSKYVRERRDAVNHHEGSVHHGSLDGSGAAGDDARARMKQ